MDHGPQVPVESHKLEDCIRTIISTNYFSKLCPVSCCGCKQWGQIQTQPSQINISGPIYYNIFNIFFS